MDKPAPSFESLSALRRLARESSHPGEREGARVALQRLLARHHLVEADLDSEVRTEELFAIPAGDPMAQRLGFQIVAKFAPKVYEAMERKPIMKRSGLEIYEGLFTKAEHAEVTSALSHYVNDYRDQAEAFFKAYLYKQELVVVVEDGKAREMGHEELRDLRRKMKGIDHNPNLKRLSS